MIKACNMHTIFANSYYVPFGDIIKTDYTPGDMVVIAGLEERIERIMEVDINSFEEKYGDYLSQEQVAREYFVSTGTVTSWVKKKKIVPSVEYRFGNKSIYLFSPDDVEKYRKELNIKEHNDSTIKEDFFEFLEERDYSLSYKMPFLLAILKHIDSIGDAKIEEVLDDYIAFYQDRLSRGLQVDRSTCPYDEKMLKDRKAIVLYNKTDLASAVSMEALKEKINHPLIPISAKEETGIAQLADTIKSMFFSGKISFNDEVYITNARHKEALEEAEESLAMVKQSIEDGMPEDFFSIDLMAAYGSLGKITGEEVGEDLVNEIFSKFCMGK